MARTKTNGTNTSTATIGFEAKLWLTADKLRNNMDAAEYKHVVLGLIFLKYISDTGESKKAEGRMMKAALPILTSSFILQTFPVAIERDNPRLNSVLPKDYARPGLDTATRDSASPDCEATSRDFCAAKDHQRLGELIDVIATIELTAASEGEKTHRSVDLLGRVYEYFRFLATFSGCIAKVC